MKLRTLFVLPLILVVGLSGLAQAQLVHLSFMAEAGHGSYRLSDFTPVPEPGVFGMVAAAIAFGAVGMRWRKNVSGRLQ